MTHSMTFIVEREVQHGLEQHILKLFINNNNLLHVLSYKKFKSPKFAYYIEYSAGMWFLSYFGIIYLRMIDSLII